MNEEKNDLQKDMTATESESSGFDEKAPVKKKKKKKKETFKDKLFELFNDKRPWYKRLITAALASLAFAYTLFVFGFFELYIGNATFYTFTFNELLRPTIYLGIAVTVGLTLILMLFRGRVFNYLTTAVFSTTVCAYVQCNFLTYDLGSLDGTKIDWELLSTDMLVNFVIWAVIFIIPYIVHYFNRKVWRMAVCFLSVLLILMQSAGLVQLFVTNDFLDASSGGYLSNSTIYEVSPKNNTIVFVVDRMAYSTSQNVFAKYPDIKEGLSDFTNYTNAIGSYTRTFPSVIYFLTGVHWNPDVPVGNYFRDAWQQSEFMQSVKAAGIESKVYSEVNYVIKNTANAEGRIDNIGDKELKANPATLLKSMIDLSLYRYSPLAMKPFFWCYTGDLEKISTTGDGSFASDIYATDDPGFYAGIIEQGLSVKDDSKGSFIFYHMRGSHDPFVMDENGNRVSSKDTDVHRQTAGNLRAIVNYMNLLKEKDMYDDTTVIIMADHGFTGTIPELDGARTISLYVKPAGQRSDEMLSTAAPVTHDNVRSTVMKSLGLDHSDYAPALDEIAENADITRYFYMSGCDPLRLHRDTNLVTYKVEGDANEFSNWSLVTKKPIEHPFYDAG